MQTYSNGDKMRVHIDEVPQVVIGTKGLDFKIGHKVTSVPRMHLEDDSIVYFSPERPNLLISNARPVFWHAFTIGLNLYESTGLEDDIVIFNPKNPRESSQWPKKIFYATAEMGFALFNELDAEATNVAYFQPQTRTQKSDDADGEVWLEIHVEFRAGPGQTIIGQRRRINKNTGDIEYGQTFVQPIDVAINSYEELGKAIDDALNPTPDHRNIVKLPVQEES
ncbi:MAG: hypothetical protein Hens2KO_03900 [Henriciella sp.]